MTDPVSSPPAQPEARQGADGSAGRLPAIGDTFRFAKTIGESDVYLFAGISGDFSPNHVDADYMSRTDYGQRIAHGVLSLALASTTSTQVQTSVGRPCVSYGYDRVRFLAPVFFGDTLNVRYRISQVDPASQRSWADIEIRDQRDRLCLVAVHILKFQDAIAGDGASEEDS